MNQFDKIKQSLRENPKTWLITGCAGFIGSNLLETLLKLDQSVVGLDNFSNGFQHNLEEVKSLVTLEQWKRFNFTEGDILDYKTCSSAIDEVDHILHQAALGSVPRSIKDPITSNAANITGFLNMLTAAKEYKNATFTYAASSSTYGDHPALPKVEENIGKPLSPYAVTKYVNELYADVFSLTYNFKTIGLRYFNVFGKRQSPNGAYAAVIPKWTSSLIKNENVLINGDGKTSRDFCYIDNAIQANLLAATSHESAKGQVYNVAVGDQTTLNALFGHIQNSLNNNGIQNTVPPLYRDFRPGDVRHSKADISKAIKKLGYQPKFKLVDGINAAMPWYVNHA